MLSDLYSGSAPMAVAMPDGTYAPEPPRAPGVVLSGSFNPLHIGHRRLMRAACALLGAEVQGIYEISILNADKPRLPRAELERRLLQFKDEGVPVAVTTEPLFPGKARLFRGAAFALGADTFQRLMDPRYYGGAAARDSALREFKQQGCRFIVGGRKDADGRFITADGITPPAVLEGTIEALTEDQFRADVASSLIREKQGEHDGDK